MSELPTLTTHTAATASATMGTIINGELAEQISNLIAQGNLLEDPAVWDGVHAATFRGSWPNTRTQLNEAVEQLGVLRTNIERIRTDIVTAGGGAV
ncbi:MAG: pyrophosphorylase [Acidimicrobiales bacterium]|nr:pyrophosphorylase [Acidimicrobiales bacterium]